MTTNSQPGVRPMTVGQFKTLVQIMTARIPTNMSFAEAALLIRRIGRSVDRTADEQTEEPIRTAVEELHRRTYSVNRRD